MKRNQLVENLKKEGFTEKTLANFNDKQITQLHERFFGEASQKLVKQTTYTPSEVKASQVTGRGVKVDGGEVTINKDGGMTVTHSDMKEAKLSAAQKKHLDKNKNNKIDKEDFKLLNKKKTEVAEEKKEKKWIQKAVHPSKKGSLRKALGVKKGEKIPAAKLKSAAKKGGKLGQRARFAMNVKGLKENQEMNEWLDNLTGANYHPAVSKNEIINLINEKLNLSKAPEMPEWMTYDAIMASQLDEAGAKPKEAPTIAPTEPDRKKRNPFKPEPGKKSKPKAGKKL